jgi:asparagine synthase (glutamine-hydrolysing)
VVSRDRRVAPLWDARRQQLFVGDVRLYNRADLLRQLDVGAAAGEMTDADIAWHAYLRWGDGCPTHLVGDFAFAVWDERNRSIFAARDHFGVRPLYYSADGRAAYVASDVRQLLAVTPRPFADVNAQTILERFAPGRRTHGLTFFRSISELPGGHMLTLTPNRHDVRRYWVPSFKPTTDHRRDHISEIRTLVRQAVHDRLDSDLPIVAHSSGGFDSSAILMIADEIYRDQPHRPPVVMASATTPGMHCDDSRYMDAVARRVRFEGVRWNALEPNLADIEDPILSHPGLRRGTGGGPRRDLQIARERGARVLLHGFFGDTLMYAFGVSRDMFGAGKWSEIARDVLADKPVRERIRLLGKASVGLLPPPTAMRLLRNVGDAIVGPPPEWMGRELRARHPAPPEELCLPEVAWPSHLACELWTQMSGPRVGAAVTATSAYGADDGVEVRVPYLDVRLVEKVLATPWEARLPHRGDHRRLNRDVLESLLPEEFAHRRAQRSWMPVWRLGAMRMLPAVERLIADGRWLAAPYVDVASVRSMMREVIGRGDSADQRKLFLVVGFGGLEAWLRRIFGYYSAREGFHVR